jgi:NMD protein affecting ribosome stability and mRNA decay
MNEEMKPCPGCGKLDQVEWFCFCSDCMTGGSGEHCKPDDKDGVVCHDCEISMNYKRWQSRPIEDALRAELREANRWISVDDNLPTNPRDVLVRNPRSGKCWVTYYSHRRNTWNEGEPTHWRPLPSPPEPTE